jgi:hypothetical protein
MPPEDRGIGFRRNGQRQACEPCRKGKLKCGHEAPYCARCVRRKTTDRCVYHPAPMTRARTQMDPSLAQYTPQSSPSLKIRPCTSPQNSESSGSTHWPSLGAAVPGTSTSASPRSNALVLENTQPGCQRKPRNGHPHHHKDPYYTSSDTSSTDSKTSSDSWKTAVYPQSKRYYGPTSFSAVFLENRTADSENLLDLGQEKRQHPGTWKVGEPLRMIFQFSQALLTLLYSRLLSISCSRFNWFLLCNPIL